MNITPVLNPPIAQPKEDAVTAVLSTYGNLFPNPASRQPCYSFQNMLAATQRLPIGDFEISIDDAPSKILKSMQITILRHTGLLHQMVLRNCRYFSGSPTLHFYIAKMDVQTGMLAFRFTPGDPPADVEPSPIMDNTTFWDLSICNVFTYKIPNIQPYRMRRLWNISLNKSLITNTADHYMDFAVKSSAPNLQSMQDLFGRLNIYSETPLVSGNVAPVRLTVHCFVTCEDIQVSTYGPFIN